MDNDYLIIWRSSHGNEHYLFLETGDELLEQIEKCEHDKCEVVFAGKIAVVEEFIG